ncbi:MAG TPA: hypothetical protein VKS25_14935 [Solirubrobacteraceae bacterium]|nr:hypothetical protein [Solirubrobacteraceae bacterium]
MARYSKRRQALADRLFGVAPARDAPAVERLRWLRGFNLRFAPLGVLAWVLCAVFIHDSLVYVLASVWGLWTLVSHVRLTRRIRRER